MNFPKYPAYKDSGVEWLGEIPDHWQIKALRYLTICLDGKRIPLNGEQRADKQGDIPYWGANAIMDYVDEAIFDEELLLVGEDGAPFLDPYKPVAFHSSGPVWPNNHIHVLRPNKPEWVRFLVYFMNAADYANYIEGSTRQKLNQSRLMGMPVSWPSQLEQTQIARFLDHETARIDALIEEQQRLIELLKEKRQAVISHAVTKGLDPTVPMKDSGVEWLGEVPAHWESLTLGRVASSVKTGGTPTDDLPSADIIDGVEWYTPGDFTGDLLLDGSEKRVSAEAVRSGDAKVFPSGSVLIVSIGATLGKVGHIRRPASANQQINAVVPGPRVDGYFLAYSLSVKVNALRFLSNASTIGIMNQEKTKEIWLSLPPLQEQKLITEFLDKQTSVIDTLIQEAAGGVSLLQERRSALISAAVTGKIDVRNWQPPAGQYPAGDTQNRTEPEVV